MTASILRYTHPRQSLRERGVTNNAGGEVHQIDIWSRLNRFLIIGTEGGTYYVSEKDHVLDNVKVVQECLDADAVRTINTIADISDAGRAPKNDYAVYALAVAASHANARVRQQALAKLSMVCRTGTHLFQFVACVDKMRGWGSALRKAVANWYLSKSADKLAYQVLKYQQREGWSHRDVLRKVHPKTNDYAQNTVFKYVTTGKIEEGFDTVSLIVARETAHMYDDVTITAGLIRSMNLSREMIPTAHMHSQVVQQALADTMPYTALIRNLGNLSRYGVKVDPSRITNLEVIKKSRVHPITILTALRTYAQGYGFRSDNRWPVQQDVVDALDKALYTAFKNVEPTGKRFMLGIDVSGSMSSRFGDGVLTSHEIASALAMLINETEDIVKPYMFNMGIQPVDLHRGERLDRALARFRPFNGGGTDASLLMQYALDHHIPTDVFVVITDNETWGHTYRATPAPSKLVKEYRRVMGIDAKLIVLATAATEFSIADPNDPGMLDIAGFDSSVPDIIREFALGNI